MPERSESISRTSATSPSNTGFGSSAVGAAVGGVVVPVGAAPVGAPAGAEEPAASGVAPPGMPPDDPDGAPVGAPVGAAPVVPPSTPTGRSSRALIPPRPLVALTGVSRPSTETLPTGASTSAPLIAPTTAG